METPDLSLLSVEVLMGEIDRRFDGFVFLARQITNERIPECGNEPVVSAYELIATGDLFVASGLARMLVKMTDRTLDVFLDAYEQAEEDKHAKDFPNE